MQTLIVGLVVGATMGAVAVTVLVVDPLRRERELFRDRIIREQMRTFAAEARLAAHLYPQKNNDRWSEKVTPIRVVPEPLI